MARKRVRLVPAPRLHHRLVRLEDLQRNERASWPRVSTLTQQPHPLAEALHSDRWRSGTLLCLLSFVPVYGPETSRTGVRGHIEHFSVAIGARRRTCPGKRER